MHIQSKDLPFAPSQVALGCPGLSPCFLPHSPSPRRQKQCWPLPVSATPPHEGSSVIFSITHFLSKANFQRASAHLCPGSCLDMGPVTHFTREKTQGEDAEAHTPSLRCVPSHVHPPWSGQEPDYSPMSPTAQQGSSPVPQLCSDQPSPSRPAPLGHGSGPAPEPCGQPQLPGPPQPLQSRRPWETWDCQSIGDPPSKGRLSIISPQSRTPKGPCLPPWGPLAPRLREHFNSKQFKLAKHPPGPDGTGEPSLEAKLLSSLGPVCEHWGVFYPLHGQPGSAMKRMQLPPAQGLLSPPLRASPDFPTYTLTSLALSSVWPSCWCCWAVLAWAPHSPHCHQTMTRSTRFRKVQR